MLRIRNTGVTEIVLTLTEKCTLSDPVFLFEFINQITQEKSYCICQDVSEYKDRYNKFNLNNTVNPASVLTGSIDLTTTGYYDYRVYEQSSTTNLNPALTVSMVESGIAKVDYYNEDSEYYENERNNNVYTDTRATFLTDETGAYLIDENNNYLIE